ncbi:MAG: M20 family metallopeptidase [Bacteroidota bacterium]
MRNDLVNFIREKSELLFSKVKSYREHLHQHPELSFQEFETMKFVSKVLTELNIEHSTGVGTTGITAIISSSTHQKDQACIGLRSDLDALPIIEENEVNYKSLVPGVMHACGHDVHTAILLGVAELLNEIREQLPQPVKLIFQPGEEKNPGGATLMIKDGVLENPKVEKMHALHVSPEIETGKVGFREGLYMASSDEIYITIHGKGGHGATPHKTIDPIVIGATLILQLQQIVSRKCDPNIPCVLSFGHFEAIGATNIIPEKAILKGTFRTMNEAWRKEALGLIESSTKLVVESMQGKVDVEISAGYPFLANDPTTTQQVRSNAEEILGKENVIDLSMRMTSEDFAFYSQIVPVCFFRLGTRNEEKGIIHGVHHPRFNIDDNALIIGMQVMASSVF